MTTEQPAGVMSATVPATVPAGEPVTAPEATETKQPQSLDEAMALLSEYKTQLKRVNSESAERRRKLASLEEAEVKRQQAEMSELDKLKVKLAETDDLYQQTLNDLTKLRIRHAVEMSASRLGFHRPEDAHQLMDWAGVEVDEEGNVKGIEEALKALVKERPYLIHQQQVAPDLNAQQRGAGGTRSQEEIVQRKRQEYGAL